MRRSKEKRQKAKTWQALFFFTFAFLLLPSSSQGQNLVTVNDTLRNADNTLASGRLEISWPAFKTADGFTVAAGRKNYTVTAGVVNLQLFPNAGATPSGTSYTVDYYLTSGAGREYWVVPAAGPVTIAGIRVSVAPTPSVLVSQNQLALGTGLNVLLGLSRWASGAPPAATAAGQCYYDTTADLMKCSNNALAYAPTGGGLQSLNGLNAANQFLATGTSGSDFNTVSSGTTHTFNLPNASATARGVVSTGNQTFTGEKLVDTSSGNLGGATALYGILRPTHSSGTMFFAQGLEGDVISTAAGTVETVAGVASYAQQSGTGTINSLSGFLVNPNTKFAGTVVNNYGVWVGDQAIAGANNWAIKTLSGKVEFGDQVVAKNINSVRYASQFTGADACAKIAAAITDLPSSGGTVDARGLEGAQSCASNPLAGVSKPVLLLLGAATWSIDVQWVVNASITIRGVHPSTLTDGTIIRASASFPTSTALIKLGAGVSSSHGTRIERLIVDCNDKAGGIGVLGDKVAEKSGVFESTIYNCQDAGVKIADSSSQFWSLEDVEVYSTTAMLSSTNGIEIDGGALIGAIRNVTVFPAGATVINAAVYLNNCHGGTIQNIHGEKVSSVVQVGDGTAVTGVTIDHVSGSSAGPVAAVVKIANISGTTGIRISGVKMYGATKSIEDLKSGFSLTEDSRALYVVGTTHFNSGNVGIGTLAANAKLSLGQDLTAQKLAIYDGLSDFWGFGVQGGRMVLHTSNTEKMAFHGSGGVSLGTTTDPGIGNFLVSGNLRTKSDTSFTGIFDHAITADRTWTLPDAGGNIPALPTAATTETGSGAVVRQTSPSIASPTLAGTPVIGDGAGNDKLSFAAESTNPSCAAGNFYIWANSTDNRLKKCQNGTVSDLDTTASGGGYDTLKGDSGTATRTGAEAIKIAGTSGEISTSAADGTDDTVTVSLPSTLSTAKTVSALWTFDRGTTSDQAILIAIAQPGAAGQRDSHFLDMRGASFDTGGHNADWRRFVDVTSNAGASSLVWQSRIDAATFAARATLTDAGIFNAITLTESSNAVPNSTDNLSFFAGTTSAQLAGVLSDETGSGLAVFATAPTFSTSLTTPAVISTAADPADAGAIRLGNAETIAWEASPAGTDVTLTVNAGEVLESSAPISATTGFQIGGAATTGRFLRGNGTNFIQSAGAASGTGSCTAQFVRAVNDDAAPTCATVGAADVDESTFSAITWLANADSTWTFDTTGATSPVVSFTGSAINVSTGTLQEGGVAVSLPARSETLTNKTLDVEGTGNTVTTVEKIWIPAATCVAATATLNWDDDPAAAEPTAACVAGTNTAKGVADFLDSATNAMQTHVKLPADWTGAVDVKFVWFTTVTANNAVWQIQGVCVADAETDDPAFGTASTVTDAAKATANQLNDASISGIQSNFAGSCAAGELLHLRVFRNPADASDTLAATARLYGVEVTLRRAQ